MRPRSIAEVADLALRGDDFDRCLAHFLDAFYARPEATALAPVPALMGTEQGDRGKVQDAYLAAVAEELSRRFGLPRPAWVDQADRSLRRPWFATNLAAVRAVLLLESPPGFRSRNLFVSENALSRV